MKLSYYQDTDTLHIELKNATVAETKDLDENILFDVDRSGNVLAITIEHAKKMLTLTELVTHDMPIKKLVME